MQINEVIKREVPVEDKLYHVTQPSSLLDMIKDGHVGEDEDFDISMTSDPNYSVSGTNDDWIVRIEFDYHAIKKSHEVRQHADRWEDDDKDDGDWESEHRVTGLVPLTPEYVNSITIHKENLLKRFEIGKKWEKGPAGVPSAANVAPKDIVKALKGFNIPLHFT